jgi:Tol biopolymer transport system component
MALVRTRTLIVVGLCAAPVVLAPVAHAAKGETDLISRQPAALGGAGSDGVSFNPAISGDGRYVAFESNGDNLSIEDNDGFRDVFMRDTLTTTLTLLSRRSDFEGGVGGNDVSENASLSADARYVAFVSQANNLSNADNDDRLNVFLRDTQTGATSLVSRQSAADGGAGASSDAFDQSVSDDGRFVAFASGADNLSTEDDDDFADVFVRDMQTNATILVSRRSALSGNTAADAISLMPSISADGRYVAFESDANNLSMVDNNNVRNVFVRDMQTGTTSLVSRRTAGEGAPGGVDGDSRAPVISDDGRHIAFTSEADNLSADDSNSTVNVFVRDTEASTTMLVSRQNGSGAGGDGDSEEPSLSRDGRYVAFRSEANNLSGEDNNAVANVFVRDMQASETILASRRSAAEGGGGGDGDSGDPALSRDGRYVAFHSAADNLSALDSDGGLFDIFRHDLLGPNPPGGDQPGADTRRPVIARLSLSNKVFAVGRAPTPRSAVRQRSAKRGTRFRFSLSERADLRIELRRARPGRRAGGRCRKPTRVNRSKRRCTRYVLAGVLRRDDLSGGRRSVRFSGRLGRRPLRRGGYLAVLTAVDEAGNRSLPRRVRMTIVRPR